MYQIICTNALKVASKNIFKKAAEEASDLVCNKNAVEIIKVSKRSPQSSSETAESETKKQGLTEKNQKKDICLLKKKTANY